jgi:putative ABC transport system permease protein
MKKLFGWTRVSLREIGDDVDEEIRFHLDRRTDELVALGAEPAAAAAQARREFGAVKEARDALQQLDRQNLRQVRRSYRWQSLAQDARYAVRTLWSAPIYTAAAVITLALGVGANVLIFGAAYGLLLRPLPFHDAGRIARINVNSSGTLSQPEFRDLQRDLSGFATLAALETRDANISTDQAPAHVSVSHVSGEFFRILGVTPLRGRALLPADDLPGSPPVAVISLALWQQAFGSDEAIIGKRISIDGGTASVVGVMPARFDYPEHEVALWTPLRIRFDSLTARNNHSLDVIGRLAPRSDISVLAARIRQTSAQWLQDYPEYYQQAPVVEVRPLRAALVRGSRAYLAILIGAALCVLLIACSNVANLQLARGESRRREFAVRAALGASSRRMVSQLLTESLLVAVGGGVLGTLVAIVGGHVLLPLIPASVPRTADITVDGTTFVFALMLSAGTAIVFGLLPALRAAGQGSAAALRASGRSGTLGATARARRTLVAAEVALAVTLLSGAGLLVRSLLSLQQVDLGFGVDHVLVARLSLPAGSYDDTSTIQFIDRATERVAALPGVTGAAVMGWTPIAGSWGEWSIAVDGVAQPIQSAPVVRPEQVTAGYFSTMRVAIVRGRPLQSFDRTGSPLVAVASEAMVHQLWPHVDPIGHTVRMSQSSGAWVTVVGVARDVHAVGIEHDAPPILYLPYAQASASAYYTPRVFSLVIRTTTVPEATAAAVRRSIHDLDRNVPVYAMESMQHAVDGSIADRRFVTAILVSLAVLALLLASIGIYGVVSYGVSQRTGEIGLRMALGADRGTVVGMVMTEALRHALVGLAAGLAGAVLLGQLLRSLLVGVHATDWVTLGGVTLVLLVIIAVAAIVPAARASRVSPTEALGRS